MSQVVLTMPEAATAPPAPVVAARKVSPSQKEPLSLPGRGDDARHQAPHGDPVTGLLDRSGLEVLLTQLVESGGRARGVGAMLCVDLGGPDLLEVLARQGGDDAVDEALRAAADVLRRAVRGRDPVGRLGGDDFVIVLEGLGELSNASRVAEGVLARLKAIHLKSGVMLAPRLGVTRLPTSGRAISSMFNARELALSAA